MTQPAYAGFWRRAFSLAIDAIVFLSLSQCYRFASGKPELAAIYLILAAAAAGYEVYFHARWGHSIGKMLAGIRVVRLNGNGIGLRISLLRASISLAFTCINTWIFFHALAAFPEAELTAQSSMLRVGTVLKSDSNYRYASFASQSWVWSEVVVILLNSHRRALHDFIAGTVVVLTKTTEMPLTSESRAH